MSVLLGFFILHMLFLMGYMAYRLFIRKSLIPLLCLCMQIFSISIAIISFVNNVESEIYVEILYLAAGVAIPSFFLFYDLAKMLRKLSRQGTFEGLVEKPSPKSASRDRVNVYSLKPRDIAEDTELTALMEELAQPDVAELSKNLKKYLSQAISYVKAGRLEQAERIYSVLTELFHHSGALYYNYGNLQYKLDEFEKAAESYTHALAFYEKKAAGKMVSRIYSNLGNSLYYLGRYEKAEAMYRKALKEESAMGSIDESLVAALIASGNTAKAMSYLQDRLQKNPESIHLRFILGKLYSDEKHPEDALNEFSQCIKLNPKFSEALLEQGKTLTKLGRTSEAVDIYGQYVKLKPDEPYGLYCLGTSCYQAGLKKKALDCFRKVIQLEPEHSKAYFNLAVLLEESGSTKEAAETYKTVIVLNPDFVDAYNNLAILLTTQKKPLEAMHILAEGLKRNPQEYSLHINLGMMLSEAGRYSEAAEAFKNAIKIRPDEPEVKYYLGAALTQMRNYHEAIDVYKSVLKVKPLESDIFYNLATVYSLLKKHDIAIDNLKKALELNADLKEDAKSNRAFDGIRFSSEFKALVS